MATPLTRAVAGQTALAPVYNEVVDAVDQLRAFASTKTGSYAITTADHAVPADCTGGPFTITLPSAATAGSGRAFTISKVDTSANALTIATVSAQTINGASTVTLYGRASISVMSDGANWIITEGQDALHDLVYESGFRAKSASYTGLVTDRALTFDCTSAARTLTLPTAASFGAGRTLWIDKIDSSANELIVDGNGTELVHGSLTVTIYGLSAIGLMSTGSAWVLIQGHEFINPEAFNVKWFGAKGDGSTDDAAAITVCVAALQRTVTSGLGGGNIFFPSGEYVIASTIYFNRFFGRIYGFAVGQSSSFATDPSFGSVIRWNGSAGQPMFKFNNSSRVTIEQLRMEGKDTAIPSYAIAFDSQNTGEGNNSYLCVRDCHLGRFAWSSQGTNKGLIDSGIGWIGNNANNDQFLIHHVQIHYPTSYGVYMPNAQSVGGSFYDLSVYSAGLAAAKVQASTRFFAPTFLSCAMDFDLSGSASPDVSVFDIYSEHTGLFATLGPNANLKIWGGDVQLADILTGGDVFVQMYPTNGATLHFQDINFTGMTDATQCKIDFGPVTPQTGNFRIIVQNCFGLDPAQLVLNASADFFSTAPRSKGTIEWDSRMTDARYRFRNELRRGERVTVNTLVLDYPRTSNGTNLDTLLSIYNGPTGSKTFDWPSLAAGAQQSTTVTCTGCVLGDVVDGVSMDISLALTTLTGYVSAADTVTVVQKNGTAGAIDLASGTLRVTTRKVSG